MFAAMVGIPIFAASNWPLGVLLAVPAILVLIVLAFALARNQFQRLMNLFSGLIGSIAVMMLSGWYLFERSQLTPRESEKLVPTAAMISAAVGAAMGIFLSVSVQRLCVFLVRRVRKS
jgi:chromate transport protein ChrA